MLAIGIRYIRGVSVAAESTDYDTAEWPPHPARVFMALAAAHFETGEDPAERAALEWLENQTVPPALSAPEAFRRDVVTRYVPVNDRAGPSKAILQSAPALTRDRAGRTFPTVTLADERVFLIWPVNCPEQHRAALQRACEKVSRVGHSSSLVQLWIEADPPAPNWVLDDVTPEIRLRTVSAGLLGELERAYSLNLRPRVSLWSGYASARRITEETPGTIWTAAFEMMALEPLEATVRFLDPGSTLQLTQRLHEAVLSRCPEPVPEIVSGHTPDGRPSNQPHLAYLPLPFVGHRHADGLIRGVGILLPRDVSPADRRIALAAVAAVSELRLGRIGRWGLKPVSGEAGLRTLTPRTWTAAPHGARQWATVTPLAFDRHAKGKSEVIRESEQAEMIAAACRRIGLPDPVSCVTTPVSRHQGAPAAHEFPRLRRKDGSYRRHSHAIITFERPVRGPLLIGAGRYRGYGLCRPVNQVEGR